MGLTNALVLLVVAIVAIIVFFAAFYWFMSILALGLLGLGLALVIAAICTVITWKVALRIWGAAKA